MMLKGLKEVENLPNKGEKARNNLKALGREVEAVRIKLESIHSLFEHLPLDSKEKTASTKKKRSMFIKIPNRIEFNSHGFRFYVDFSMSLSKDIAGPEIEGIIIYGASRSLCFADCLLCTEKITQEQACKKCDRIARCDACEDKPLLRFTINRHGRIASIELDDEWWVTDTKMNEKGKVETSEKDQKNVTDLHYRAIDRIWGDAVDWTNENILP
jgi:hypothetical protein